MYAIGIDLGTTNSCVAVRDDGKEKVLENDTGNRTTPSCVTFSRERTLIGEQAKHLLTEEPENAIYSIKRIIGRKFDDPKTQEDIKRWKFKVESLPSGRPIIKINHRKETYNVEEISGLVLAYMRQIACQRLDEDVRDAVVTVPAYFNHMQRSATNTAAELAGLNVLGIINEPTAAAIAFGLVKKYTGDRNILVYDFGGGTLDVTVLSINGNEFNVKASSGNSRLGGDDLTNRLVDHCVEYMKTHMEKDIINDKGAMSKLLVECEKAKKELSFRFEYTLLVVNIIDGMTLRKTVNRAKFVSLIRDLLDKTMDYVKDAIEQSGMEKEDINFVVPVGGSSKIPYIEGKLKNHFGEGRVKADRNPEQTIAKGAAAYAAYLKGDSVQQISEIRLSEVTPLSLGIKLRNLTTSVIVERNTKVPVTKSEIYNNAHDFQTVAGICVCQGEEELFEDNEYLGMYELAITPMPRGEVKVDVEFTLDLNGTLNTRATEKSVGRSESTVIDLCGTLEKLDTKKLKRKLEMLMSEGREYDEYQKALYHIQTTMPDLSTHVNPQMVRRSGQITQWFHDNPPANISEYQKKSCEIKEFHE